MRVGVYTTSGGKDIVLGQNYSPEGKAKILSVLQILKAEGTKNFDTRPANKNSRPKLFEIKKDDVRVFYFWFEGDLYISHIVEHKQKNKTETNDKELATKRIQRMINNPNVYVAWL